VADRRVEVERFADQMEAKLRENDHKNGWKNCTVHWLLARLCEETAELVESFNPASAGQRTSFAIAANHLRCAAEALDGFGPYVKVRPTATTRAEAADVGNFAMMISDITEVLHG